MTESQLQYLLTNGHRYTSGELAEQMGVHPSSVWYHARKLGVITQPQRRPGRAPMGVPCLQCGRKGRTIATRAQDGAVRRRYECSDGHRWSTWESYREDSDE